MHTYGWQTPPARWQVFADKVAGFLRAGGWIAPVFTRRDRVALVTADRGAHDLQTIRNICL